MSRRKDVDWNIPEKELTWEQASVAVLMDLRDELKEISHSVSVLQCSNFIRIPKVLDRIARNTKPKAVTGKRFYAPKYRRKG
jgi:hypothetical protein